MHSINIQLLYPLKKMNLFPFKGFVSFILHKAIEILNSPYGFRYDKRAKHLYC